MSQIRPLEPQDLPAVAELYELVIRSGTTAAPPGLASYIHQLAAGHPFADPEIPSLVYDEPGHGIVGFIASYARRFVLAGRPVRMACSGQLVAHPDFRSRGVGALLLRRYLAGDQDFTVTDGATREVRDIWQALGGTTNTTASLSWMRLLNPASYALAAARRRRGLDLAPVRSLAGLLDRAVVARPVRPRPTSATTEPLTPEALVSLVATLDRRYALRPAYDTAFAAWLFREAEAVTDRGTLVRHVVRGDDGRVAGWYVAYMSPDDTAQVVQVAGNDPALVVDALVHEAQTWGATAVQGRLEPILYPHLIPRRCLFRPSAWALVHSRDRDLLATVLGGNALVSRLDGEWWMGHHRLDAEALARRQSGDRPLHIVGTPPNGASDTAPDVATPGP